ncbi:MAG: prenyltransferase [Thermoplasmata archaeon]|nr:MAG: prenyltransferase [Thermoplasmata archaeon]
MGSTFFKGFIRLSRPQFLLAGILPYCLGLVVIVYENNTIYLDIAIVSFFGIIITQQASRYSNDYFDYETDMMNKERGDFSGGSGALVEGLIDRKWALFFSIVCFIIGAIIFLILAFIFETGPLTVPLYLMGAFLAYAYVGPPFKLAYRGLGEIALGSAAGLLIVPTVVYLQTGTITALTILTSIPLFFIYFISLLGLEFPDWHSDKLTGKRNLMVKLGKMRAARLYLVLLVFCYALCVIFIFFGLPLLVVLLIVLSIPLHFRNISSLKNLIIEGKETVIPNPKKIFLAGFGFLLMNLLGFILAIGVDV